MEKNLIGLAGEFYALAQLTHHGLVASLTLGHTKGVDILVTNQDLNSVFKVEVKTTNKRPRNVGLFGDEMFYVWPMSSKHETLFDDRLIYCFVFLQETTQLPKFFILPSREVAKYVKWQHEYWLSTRKNPVKATSIRNFRIEVSDPNGYEDNWSLFRDLN